MTPMTRIPTAVASAACLLVAAACGFEPDRPRLHYGLNEREVAKYAALATDPAARAQLLGALELLCGTPEGPAFLRLESWEDEEFDPNLGGYAELSDEDFDQLKRSNAKAFASQIAAIEASRFDEVERPRFSDDLWAGYQTRLADLKADPDAPLDASDPAFTRRLDAISLFESYYPSLATSAEFYRQQCFHCHGAEGGGDGSTSAYLNPRPRDYRPGKFKFTALNEKARPRREDLFRILAEGIYTTAMPSFRRFSDAQLHGLVDYVRLLAVRGETEILLASEYDPDAGFSLEWVQENYALVWEFWRGNTDKLIAYDGEIPKASPERIAHGRELYLGETQANCIKCHGATGRGDGVSAKEINPVSGVPELAKDDWGNQIQPRDLTRGLYRFGRRPIDVYRRIYAGINGTPMPAHIGMQVTEVDGTKRELSEDDIWDMVHFVRSLGSHDQITAAETHDEGHTGMKHEQEGGGR